MREYSSFYLSSLMVGAVFEFLRSLKLFTFSTGNGIIGDNFAKRIGFEVCPSSSRCN
jgi:hypothetical protein